MLIDQCLDIRDNSALMAATEVDDDMCEDSYELEVLEESFDDLCINMY